MSRVTDSLWLQLEVDQAAQVCRQAVADTNWRVLESGEDYIVAKEVTPTSVSFTNAARLKILIEEDEGGALVTLEGWGVGLGPIQKGHVKGQLGALKNRIVVATEAFEPPGADQSGQGFGASGELERMAALHRSGALTDEEFAQAKARILSE